VKKCQELERKALTIVPNFSKDGGPAKKKNTDAPPPEFNWRLQLLVVSPQKKNRQKSE
jgi:hypothetical protein